MLLLLLLLLLLKASNLSAQESIFSKSAEGTYRSTV